MENSVQAIALDKLIAHPDNPNKMSQANFSKLVRNIEHTGRYEPLIARPAPGKEGLFQIINGHHRHQALAKLGYKNADVIIWDTDDEQTDILLTTLNRLCGSDELSKKLALLKRLNKKLGSGELAKLLPQTAKQVERLVNLKMSVALTKTDADSFLTPLVFFVNNSQRQIIENALSLVEEPKAEMTNAAKRAVALLHIAGHFSNHSRIVSGGLNNVEG